MATTSTLEDVKQTKAQSKLQRLLLTCGILSSLLYIAMNIFVPMLYKGYSSASQTVSELSAIGAPTRPVWVILGAVYTILMLAFGWGVWQSGDINRRVRIVGALILAYGAVGILWAFGPMHQREALAAGQGSLSDTIHIVITVITVLLMTIAMIFGATAFGKTFRVYSFITIVTLLAFGVLTGLEAPKMDANLPTPMIGVWERINIGVFLLWVIVLALVLLRRENRVSSFKASTF